MSEGNDNVSDDHVTVDLFDPDRKRQALALVLRMYAAGVGVDRGGGEPFKDEATRITKDLLGDLEFGADTTDETLNELTNRIVHALFWSTVIGFRALVMLENARGDLDYNAALREIEIYADDL
jgi:hypothetical protein